MDLFNQDFRLEQTLYQNDMIKIRWEVTGQKLILTRKLQTKITEEDYADISLPY